jgi:hypothetical protein
MQSQVLDSLIKQTRPAEPLLHFLRRQKHKQEFLEGIRLSFQPDDAEFAETTHEELYHELLAIPQQARENAQQGFMKMALAATTYAQRARLDLHTMKLAQGPSPTRKHERHPAYPSPGRKRKIPLPSQAR